MQVLYVVEFELASHGSGVAPEHAALESVASWLSYRSAEHVSSDALRVGGRLELTSDANHPGLQRVATWIVVGEGDPWALRLEIRDEDENTGSVFLTRLTVGQVDGLSTARISMARESSPTWLSPSPPADLRQPGVVQELMRNDSIGLAIAGQKQDGRYIQVRSDDEVAAVVAAIENPARLPLLLVHTRTLPALAAARIVANKLVGLVRVVTLDYRASRLVEEARPGYAPPYAGARLIWSDPAAPTVSIDASTLDAEDPDLLRSHLMRMLAPLSVLARGLDHAFRRARRVEIFRQQHAARARSEKALSTGDPEERLKALEDEIVATRANADEWEELASEEEERANRFHAEAEKVPALEEQVAQLLVALRAVPKSESQDSEHEDDPWQTYPALSVGDADSASSLFLHLEDISSSRIIFTERAATTWKKSKYPYPEEMAECLIKLARVAVTLYDGSHKAIPYLDDWIRDEFDLKVALQDDTIEKNSNLRSFTDSGKSYDRTPHVKVRDHTAPSQVGRIHFALDSEEGRLIVDHVGLKLY